MSKYHALAERDIERLAKDWITQNPHQSLRLSVDAHTNWHRCVCALLTGIEEDIVQKSLQETLFHCVGLELDLSVAECQRKALNNFRTLSQQHCE